MLVAMLFTACGDDDDEPQNPPPQPEPEKPAVISFDDFSNLIDMSYSSMIKQFPNPIMQFGDFYMYENVKPNVEGLTIAVNPDNKTVYMVIESLKENAYKEADIDAYFKSKLKFYGVEKIAESEGVPTCECGGIIKPDVVLYEEALPEDTVMQALEDIRSADVLIVAGTSLTVYPAASYIRYFGGDHMILINRDATPYDHTADLVIHDKVGEVLSAI